MRLPLTLPIADLRRHYKRGWPSYMRGYLRAEQVGSGAISVRNNDDEVVGYIKPDQTAEVRALAQAGGSDIGSLRCEIMLHDVSEEHDIYGGMVVIMPRSLERNDPAEPADAEPQKVAEAPKAAEPRRPVAPNGGKDVDDDDDDDDVTEINITINADFIGVQTTPDNGNEKGCGCTTAIIILVISTLLAIFF